MYTCKNIYVSFLACLHGLFGIRRPLLLIDEDFLRVYTSLLYVYTSLWQISKTISQSEEIGIEIIMTAKISNFFHCIPFTYHKRFHGSPQIFI